MSKSKFEERKKRVAEIMGKMDKAVENHFTTPEQLKEYIAFMSKFYDYSPRNSSLIQSQFKGATAVGSFKFWEDKGYSVKKREKGIQILVPNKVAPKFKDKEGKWKNLKYASKEEKEQIEKGQLEKKEGKMYFNVSHVFDISQTNAKVSDLPEIFPNRWLEGEVHGYNTIMSSLYDIAEEMEVSVGEPFGELGSAKGAFYHSVDANNNGHIGLNPRNSELQNVKTMIHELAHAKLHHSNHENHTKLLDAEKEFQAEMVAYSVASYFGIDTSDYSLQYLYSWTKNKEIRDKATLMYRYMSGYQNLKILASLHNAGVNIPSGLSTALSTIGTVYGIQHYLIGFSFNNNPSFLHWDYIFIIYNYFRFFNDPINR